MSSLTAITLAAFLLLAVVLAAASRRHARRGVPPESDRSTKAPEDGAVAAAREIGARSPRAVPCNDPPVRASRAELPGATGAPGKHTWESIPDDAGPLLAPGRALSLSELDVAAEAHHSFLVGSQLALMHLHGFVVVDAHPGNFVFNVRGKPIFVDGGGVQCVHHLDPLAMMPSFAVILATYPWSDFRAIAAGFARAAYVLVDPAQPGYTEDWIAALGGEIRNRPSALANRQDVEKLLSAMRAQLAPGENNMVLRPLDGARRNDIHTPGAALLLTCLVLAGVDVGPWVAVCGQPTPGEVALINGRSEGAPSGAMDAIAAEVLTALGPAAAAHVPRATAAATQALGVISAEDRATFVDGVSEILADIAARQTASDVSVALSTLQTALILFQGTIRSPRRDESRYVRLMRSHARVPGVTKRFADLIAPRIVKPKSAPGVSTHAEVAADLAYRGSVRTTQLALFRASLGLDSAPLWGLVWPCIDDGLLAIHQVLGLLLDATISPEHARIARHLLWFGLSQHAAILQAILLAMSQGRRTEWVTCFTVWRSEPRGVVRDLEWTLRTAETVKGGRAGPLDYRQWIAEVGKFLDGP